MDDEVKDLKLNLDLAFKTIRALSMRLDAQGVRIDQLEKRLNDLEEGAGKL